jgi:divalent metal cation (Fe/Co/Zn/Cd) transporter
MIIKAAYDLTKEASQGLVDASISVEELKAIDSILEKHNGHFSAHKSLRARKSGAKRFIDLKLELDGCMQLSEVHTVCDDIEEELEKALPGCDVTIHCEPACPSPEILLGELKDEA